jgi:heme O synthase-like polyprenyltransferase
MLSVRDADGAATARQAVLYSLALIVVSVLPPFFGLAGTGYLIGAALAGAALTAAAVAFYFNRSNTTARRLFMLSNLYLVVVMLLLVL